MDFILDSLFEVIAYVLVSPVNPGEFVLTCYKHQLMIKMEVKL